MFNLIQFTMRTNLNAFAIVALTFAILSCNKETPITPLNEESETVVTTNVATKAYGDKTPKMAVYVEINDVNPLNALDYYLSDGSRTFDIVEYFAANLNEDPYNTDVPCVYFNNHMATIVNDTTTYIKPIKDAGMIPILTILPNWDNMGLCTLDDDQAETLAELLVGIIDDYGFGGIGLDDEYEGTNYTTVSGSYGNLITKLHNLLPADKLITVFQYGHYSQIGSTAGSYIDYAYTNFTYYSLNSSSSISGVTNAHWAPMSINLGSSYSSYARSAMSTNAASAANNNYGAFMFFNLREKSSVNPVPVLTAVTSGAYGLSTTVNGGDRTQPSASTPFYYTIDGIVY